MDEGQPPASHLGEGSDSDSDKAGASTPHHEGFVSNMISPVSGSPRITGCIGFEILPNVANAWVAANALALANTRSAFRS